MITIQCTGIRIKDTSFDLHLDLHVLKEDTCYKTRSLKLWPVSTILVTTELGQDIMLALTCQLMVWESLENVFSPLTKQFWSSRAHIFSAQGEGRGKRMNLRPVFKCPPPKSCLYTALS